MFEALQLKRQDTRKRQNAIMDRFREERAKWIEKELPKRLEAELKKKDEEELKLYEKDKDQFEQNLRDQLMDTINRNKNKWMQKNCPEIFAGW